ncbi:MAG: DUF4954 family protein, partial [Chitinophagaceae bacterium]
TQIIKVKEAYAIYKKLVVYYAMEQICLLIERKNITSFDDLQQALPTDTQRSAWQNIGGQLLPQASLQSLFHDIKTGKITGWNGVHSFYVDNSKAYPEQKLQHAYASLLELLQITSADFTNKVFLHHLEEAQEFKAFMLEGITVSRAKDYQNSFRKMVYDNEKEMEEVIGRFEDNSFTKQQTEELQTFQTLVSKIKKWFGLQTA